MVVPARTSVVKVVFLSVSLKCFPTRFFAMKPFRRVKRDKGGGGGVTIADPEELCVSLAYMKEGKKNRAGMVEVIEMVN